MLPFLIVISFILHFFSLFCIVLLSLQLKKLKEREAIDGLKQEIEEVFSAYLLEMKEENEKLMNNLRVSVQTIKNKKVSSTNIVANSRGSGVDKLEPKPLSSQNILQNKSDDQHENENSNFLPPITEENEQLELSYEAQAIALHRKGLGIEEIAKALNKGKTEIELILKFRQ